MAIKLLLPIKAVWIAHILIYMLHCWDQSSCACVLKPLNFRHQSVGYHFFLSLIQTNRSKPSMIFILRVRMSAFEAFIIGYSAIGTEMNLMKNRDSTTSRSMIHLNHRETM